MSVTGSTYNFTADNVNGSPEVPGVYALFRDGALIYYGRASASIRARLQSHFRGDEGPCTKSATQYRREPCTNPVSRESALLQEFVNANGVLPRCNERMD